MRSKLNWSLNKKQTQRLGFMVLVAILIVVSGSLSAQSSQSKNNKENFKPIFPMLTEEPGVVSPPSLSPPDIPSTPSNPNNSNTNPQTNTKKNPNLNNTSPINVKIYAIATLQQACAPWDGPAIRIKAQTAEGPTFLASIWGSAIESFNKEESVKLTQKDNMSKASTGLAIRCEEDKCVSIDLEIKSKNIDAAKLKNQSSAMGEMVYEGKKIPFLLTHEKKKSAQICG